MTIDQNLLPAGMPYNPHEDSRLFPKQEDDSVAGTADHGPVTPYFDKITLLTPREQGGHDALQLTPRLKSGQAIGRVSLSRGRERLKSVAAISSQDFPGAEILTDEGSVVFSGQVFSARPFGEPKLIYVQTPNRPWDDLES